MKKHMMAEIIKDKNAGGVHTAEEITGQPELWLKVWEAVKEKKKEISVFLNKAKRNPNLHVILTGAGTSAFIGNVLEGIFQKKTGMITKAVPTTDLITHPDLYFQKDKDVLLISFARSGNSPESMKAVQLAGQLSHSNLNLVITCSEKSKLVDAAKNNHSLTFILPPEANDKSLAMTGSFTSMLLAGILIADINLINEKENEVSLLAKYGKTVLNEYMEPLIKVSEINFERAAFLGSGLMQGIARESQLKLQELTDGKVICKYDTFMGLRHGPKAVINERTLITYLFSNNKYVNRYEVDLVKEINQGRRPIFTIGVMENKIKGVNPDLEIILDGNNNRLSEEFLAIVSVVPAQMLGYLKSIQLGLKPDSPSESGMIHRVVKGVKIYPYENKSA